jgi:DNA mismatch repair ATPase MutS
VIDRAALPDLVQSLFGYLNMLFLFDIVIFLRSVRVLRKNQPAFARIFDGVGSLDAAISVASFHDGVPVIAVPTLTDRRQIEATGLYHPLISEPVENDFSLDERSALIAGPNMAGKTAFIRTIGINLILARTLHFCLARSATLPRAIVRSAIRREDHLSDGQSYFFTEVRQVLEFTRCDDAGPLHVFLIDEIFRGTNTVERIASSAAVLRHLGRHHLVCATTHDVELQEILGAAFAMHHFSDDVTDGKYGFDYRLRPGPVRSRNAIRLLEITGYPPAVVREAEELARWLDARSLSAGPATPPAPPAPDRDAAGRDDAGPPNNAHDNGASVSATGIR